MAKKPAAFKSALAFPNRGLAYLYNQIEQQRLVLQQIKSVLPDGLAKHVSHCVVNDKKLLLYTHSAAWASQLRFHNKALLAAIAPITQKSVTIMQVKVLLEDFKLREGVERKANLPSSETIAVIQNQSASVSDNRLKQALLKLTVTLNRLSDK